MSCRINMARRTDARFLCHTCETNIVSTRACWGLETTHLLSNLIVCVSAATADVSDRTVTAPRNALKNVDIIVKDRLNK